MTTEKEKTSKVPVFDGHYDHWSMMMENLLRAKVYWSIVEDGVYVPPPGATLGELKNGEESKLKDFKANIYLFQAIDRSTMEMILVKVTTKDIWDSMKQKCHGSAKVKRAQLMAAKREFQLLGQKEGESINDYVARTMQVVNKMQICGEKVPQLTIVEKILCSLTKKFNYVICSIIESHDITTLSVDSLQSILIIHETMMECEKEEEQALKITNGGRGTGNRGVGRSDGRSHRGRARGTLSKDKESVECYNCHKMGHYQNECPNLENKVNFADVGEEEEEILLMVVIKMDSNNEGECMAVTEEGSNNEGKWFLDSSCSNHMSGYKN